MRTSYITPAIVKALHIVIDEAGGTWRGSAAGLHTTLVETVRGPLLTALPITPTALIRVLVELAGADEDETGLRITRDRSRWVLSVATPDDDADDDWVF